MFDSFEDLINANNRALRALNQCLTRLNHMTIGTFPEGFALLQAHIGRVTSQINLLNVINAHLAAATTQFKPLDAATQERLQQAFDKVDQAIINDVIIGATIDTVNDIFSAATRIGNITNGAA